MKIIAKDGTVLKDEDEFEEYVTENVDEEYLEEFLDNTYDGYSDNLNDWSPSEIYRYITGNLDAVREDEDLFEYLNCYTYESDYHGFDAEEYPEGETEFTICKLIFTIEYEEGDFEEEEDAEE